MRILLIEDNPDITSVVRKGLLEAHFDVEAASDGAAGLEMARTERFSLIILDIMLPGVDGWRICEQLREDRDCTPILMLTARDSLHDRVRGLELGADDYLVKPFEFSELLARVQALIRRDRMNKSRVIRVGGLEIDTGMRRVTRDGREISLTAREYDLLAALASYEGRVLTREVIQERVWMDDESTSNTVDAYIKLLRRKVDCGDGEKLIHTVHGVGYKLQRGADS